MTPVAVSKDGVPDDGGVGERDDVALESSASPAASP
jgi:hypothetical protein